MKELTQPTLTIDGKTVLIEGERNLLELVRKAEIDLPTFCYHSELSVYGACRLCLVQVEGRGIMGACSTPPEPGLKILTTTPEIREIRRIAVELLLANHDQQCPTCARSANCQLQSLAQRLGIRKVRFKSVHAPVPLDESSPSLVRDPNKCVLCGDCVRMCSEIQGIGAIDFAHRGHDVSVQPAFGKQLGDVECVNCGQCASVCPTGALTPKSGGRRSVGAARRSRERRLSCRLHRPCAWGWASASDSSRAKSPRVRLLRLFGSSASTRFTTRRLPPT